MASKSKRLIWRNFSNERKAQRIKLAVIGKNGNDGLLMKLFLYLTLSVVAFLYLQPLLQMVSTMFKSVSDLIDPMVRWFPTEWYVDNIRKAWVGLNYPVALMNTTIIALSSSIVQVFVCAVTGYGLARLRVPGKNIIFFLVILTFIIPPQIIIIPLYVLYSNLGWLGTPFVFMIPALFGQGVKSALFIVIFRQFFLTQPKSLEEAAKLDGASTIRLFFRIMLPLARSACIVVFLFSFIWYWNLYYEASMFLGSGFTPLSIRLEQLEIVLAGENPYAFNRDKNPVTEGAKMAASFLIILPPLLLFLIAQRWFVESIDRSGIVE